MNSEVEVNTKRLVELRGEFESEGTDHLAEPIDRNGPNLLGLGLGIDIETGLACGQQHLHAGAPNMRQ